MIKVSKEKVVLFIFTIILCWFCSPASSLAGFDNSPIKIIIPSAQISLEVKPAQINLDTWEVRLDAASFGESSTLPGNKGNTIIFSHALPSLFQNLSAIKTGDTINIFTETDWFVYKVVSAQTVDPNNIDILKQSNPYQLTLYTCTGPNYSNRYVLIAVLQSNTSLFNY